MNYKALTAINIINQTYLRMKNAILYLQANRSIRILINHQPKIAVFIMKIVILGLARMFPVLASNHHV